MERSWKFLFPSIALALVLRLYWPKETLPSIIDGSWKPPAVQIAK